MAAEETRNSVEFIAFLLWYSFLVFCCVLPTCCAYRRRQMLMQLQREEAEFEQRYFFGGGQFGVAGGGTGNGANQLGNGTGMDEEEARAERTRRITTALKATSFVVDEKDILKNKEYLAIENGNADDDDDDDDDKKASASAIQVDEELGAAVSVDGDMMDQNVLQLPSDGENAGQRLVSGGCAICLDTYRSGDEVIWSPESFCPHAFHHDCIIPWLAKKEEPKCPCCRQTFCDVEPVRAEPSGNTSNLSPFGLVPSGFIMRQNVSQNGRELIIIPSANLIVSQTVNDQGVVGLRIAERDPPTTDEGATDNAEQSEEAATAAEENSSGIDNGNDNEPSSCDQTSDEIVPQASSEIEMEEIGEHGAALDGEQRSTPEQSAVQDSSDVGVNVVEDEDEAAANDSSAK
mmetsp:Transcript_18861/g.46736  ORF Transcript_18861/g.46736 Transcript_18861/m.46736 type:complete len:404 (-) Transcript_18861:339-1550(-)